MRLPNPIEISRSLCERSFRDFCEASWPIVEPTTDRIDNWHLHAICEHLEAVKNREIRRLVINVPPGSSKTITCSVQWPAWLWATEPGRKIITASYDSELVRRDSRRTQQLMLSDWYRARWGSVWRPDYDNWNSNRYTNNMMGYRLATTPGGRATGEHADDQMVDDPSKPRDADNRKVDTKQLAEVLVWWANTMASRITNHATATRTIVMQRLHVKDLSGVALEQGYEHLNLPMEYEKKCVVEIPHNCSVGKNSETHPPTSIGFKDPRIEEGALLWPERFPKSVLSRLYRELGPSGVASQMQQRPTPASGGLWTAESFLRWTAFPKQNTKLIQSWDCAFKGNDDSDSVSGQVWAMQDGNYYLVDRINEKLDFPQTCAAIEAMARRWPQATKILVEDKANGPAVISTMQRKFPGMEAVNPCGGKWVRAVATAPLFKCETNAGNVYIPADHIAPWAGEYIRQFLAFTGQDGQEDDDVDATTQALNYLYHGVLAGYWEAFKKQRN